MSKGAATTGRIVSAPTPLLRGPALPTNRVTSVLLNPHEEVRWIWTHALGGSYVSGYTIVDTRPRKPRTRRAKRWQPSR